VIGCKRPTDVVLRLGELALLATNVPLVALVRLYLGTRYGLVPEEKEQNDDRDWNAEQPEKCTSSHCCLRCCSWLLFVNDNGVTMSKFRYQSGR
jgi:hypothetical protein